VKVRIGIGTGLGAAGPDELAAVVDAIADHGFDSIWLPEILTGPGPDPLVGLAWAAAYSPSIKLGTTMLVTGQNVVHLAKSMASLDVLSSGRLLLTLVPGLALAPERSAIGVAPIRRAAAIEETMPLLRRLWAGETVTHHGDFADLDAVTLGLLPHQTPLELWLGGLVPAALERCGRLGDGWLPALCTPDEAAAGREVIDAAAAKAGRAISGEHFGVSLAYTHAPLDEHARAGLSQRARGHDLDELVPVGLDALRRQLERFIAVGFSKFVVRPTGPVTSWDEELARLDVAVGDLQT
jgi:probable F420-dependent oxidoreductase